MLFSKWAARALLHVKNLPALRKRPLLRRSAARNSTASSGSRARNMPRAGALLLALAAVLVAAEWAHASYIDPGDEDVEISVPDYGEDPADLQLLQDVGKRACVRRGGNCDHRPGDCCHSSSCRCNLWGSNCRCQRMGLFQKWG